MFGRGLVPLDNGKIYEFQTAKICKPEAPKRIYKCNK